jgi:hypothetical protein
MKGKRYNIMADTSDMTDAELDSMIENNPSEFDESSSEDHGIQGDPDVKPLDDTEEEQSHDETESTDDGQDEDEYEDSEGSTSTEDEEPEVGSEEESEGDDETLEDNSETEQTEESEADNEPSEEQLTLPPLRANGKEYPINDIGEIYTMAAKGVNYIQKMQELSPYRKTVMALKSNDITDDDINLLIDLKSGNKDAVISLLKANEIDPLEVDTDAFNGYNPKDHMPSDFEVSLDEVVEKVKARPKYEESVGVIMNQWDEKSKESFYRDPKILDLLNIDMQPDPKTGKSMYDLVAPRAEKLKLIRNDGKSDLEYYMEAGQEVIAELNEAAQKMQKSQETEKKTKTRKKQQINKKKKTVSPSGGKSPNKGYIDFSDMSDEELDSFLAKNP